MHVILQVWTPNLLDLKLKKDFDRVYKFTKRITFRPKIYENI